MLIFDGWNTNLSIGRWRVMERRTSAVLWRCITRSSRIARLGVWPRWTPATYLPTLLPQRTCTQDRNHYCEYCTPAKRNNLPLVTRPFPRKNKRCETECELWWQITRKTSDLWRTGWARAMYYWVPEHPCLANSAVLEKTIKLIPLANRGNLFRIFRGNIQWTYRTNNNSPGGNTPSVDCIDDLLHKNEPTPFLVETYKQYYFDCRFFSRL